MILSLGLVDWSADPNGLRQGDLSSLTDCVAEAIRTAASLPEVVALADALGQPAVAVVVALLARAERSRNRSAARLARSVLAGAPRKLVAAAVQRLGF
jgi:hypothetical protein